MKLASRIFALAGVYGLLVLLPQYFLEARIGREAPPAITHPEYFYGFVGVALAWQVLFLVIARAPVRYRGAMLPAILEKLSFFGAAVVLRLQGRLSLQVLVFAFVDLLFAALFVVAYRSTRAAAAASHAGG